MTKESFYIAFIEHLMENLDNKKLSELHKEMSSERLTLLSEYYNCIAIQGLKSDCDLVAQAKIKIEVLNDMMMKADRLI